MKNLIFLSLVAILALSSFIDKTYLKHESGSQSQTQVEKWYEGGNLHKSTLAKWKTATEKNKLATCADFMAIVNKNVSMTELKKRATALKKSIDEATKGVKSTNNMKVSEVAASCIKLLGYK